MKLNQNKSHYFKKIAIVHDYIKEFGGAESVLEELSEIFPDAPIYTAIYKPEFLGPHRNRLEKKWGNRIHQSFLKNIPFAHRLISPLRLLSPFIFKSFDFSQFDIIITSATGAYFPNLLNKKNAKLICYCHTPPRYLYGLPTARNFTKNKIIRIFVQFVNIFLKKIDFNSAQNVDQFIANSQTTADRIKKFYHCDSVVINPPVNLSKSKIYPKESKLLEDDFFLTGGRLARAKRYDIAIQACNKLNLKLKIFGRDFAGFSEELKSIAGANIEFLGEISQSQKDNLYSKAKAFIFCSDNEDFGIAPVEAMGHGCPVIAYKSGGTTETVIDGITGVFFNELNQKSCADAIQKFQGLKISPKDCISRASNFSTEKFIFKIKKLISQN